MRIKSYKCSRFAGLKDVELEFSPGINVILGPNESGKSTIIDGIHSTIFKDIKLMGNNRADKDFRFKFMPKPDGDFIDGKVIIESSNGDYEISKQWGSSIDIKLLDPQESIIKDKNQIADILDKVLIYGESTYSNIVFAKQRDLKQALHNIVENSEINREVNDLLRNTLMELDGISIDKIENNIEAELEGLYKRWDRDKNHPENNRGVNNPYKVGLGKIVESYYNRENLKIKMQDADKSEKIFKMISDKININKAEKAKLEDKKKKLEMIEDDVNNIEIINTKIYSLEKELETIKKVNSDWPKSELKLEQLESRKKEIDTKKNSLSDEKKGVEKWDRKKKLKEKLDSIDEIEKKIEKIKTKIKEIPFIEEDDIEDLNNINREVSTLETAMKAGKMMGSLKKSKGKEVYVSRDFGEYEALELDTQFYANGMIDIKYGDEFEIQIQTGEIDFEKLNSRYIDLKEKYTKKLYDLNIDSLELGKLNLEKINDLNNKKDEFKRDIEYLLGDCTKDQIKEEFKSLEDVKNSRSLEEIDGELETIRNEELDVSSNIRVEKSKIDYWKQEYENIDNLFDLVIEKHSVFKEEKKKLDGLKPLPKEYESTKEFKEELKSLRQSVEDYQKEYEDLKDEYYRAEKDLSDTSYEELEKEYRQSKKEFDRNINRGEKLLEIRRVFFETKENLSKDPMLPVVKEFTRLLDIVTAGSYETGDIDEEFNIRIKNSNGEIPIELLSAGTYDAVTLALRFTLLKWIFKDSDGYVILDDCLVDLDPLRKRQSIELINEFAKEHQIIFTTCDPETADMLGGNIIEL